MSKADTPFMIAGADSALFAYWLDFGDGSLYSNERGSDFIYDWKHGDTARWRKLFEQWQREHGK